MNSLWKTFVFAALQWPQQMASYFSMFGALVPRLVVGEVFMTSGWGKLNNIDQIIENFIGWGIPFPQVLTPFTAGAEFLCGIFLMLGLFTRLSSGVLGVIMLVAIKSALWDQVDSLDTLLGFSETAYLAIFFWLAVDGAGKISLDYLLTPKITP